MGRVVGAVISGYVVMLIVIFVLSTALGAVGVIIPTALAFPPAPPAAPPA